MIATNAGGINVVRYGTMRAQVMGVEAVLGDGSVVSHLAGLPKDNTGYDLAGLLTGSEGTLGIVTAARLRLVPRLGPPGRDRGLGFPGVGRGRDRGGLAAVDACPAWRPSSWSWPTALPSWRPTLGLEPPDALRAPAALIVEVAAASPTRSTSWRPRWTQLDLVGGAGRRHHSRISADACGRSGRASPTPSTGWARP